MSEQTPFPEATRTIAQELGADPEAARNMPSGAIRPFSFGTVIRDLTRQHPFTMLGIAFVAGAAYAARKHGS